MIKKQYDVFISYRRDKGSELARYFNSELEKSGHDVFMDVNELNAGVFSLELEQAVINSDLILVLLTDGTLDRMEEPEEFVRKELDIAYDKNKPLFIVCKIEDTYHELNNKNSAFLKKLSEQNIIEYNHNLADEIVRNLKNTLEKLKNHKFDFDEVAKDINTEEKGKLDFIYNSFKHKYIGELRFKRPYNGGILTDIVNNKKYDGIWYGWETPEYSGKGKVYIDNNLIYEGAWKKMKYSGEGKLEEKDGFYEGCFVDGIKEGSGKKAFNNGDVYDGEWSYDKMKGYGEIKLSNGDYYKGQFSNNQINGLGKYLYNDGNKYDGDFAESKPYGYGVMIYKSGLIYNGKWSSNKRRNKEGTLKLESKPIYEGNWSSDLFDGYGEFYYSNGMVYNGNWSYGIKKGNGVLLDENGSKLYVGLFNKNDEIDKIGLELYQKLAQEEYDRLSSIDFIPNEDYSINQLEKIINDYNEEKEYRKKRNNDNGDVTYSHINWNK